MLPKSAWLFGEEPCKGCEARAIERTARSGKLESSLPAALRCQRACAQRSARVQPALTELLALTASGVRLAGAFDDKLVLHSRVVDYSEIKYVTARESVSAIAPSTLAACGRRSSMPLQRAAGSCRRPIGSVRGSSCCKATMC